VVRPARREEKSPLPTPAEKETEKRADVRTLLLQGAAEGARSLVIWADVLDRINVFPVADGDTGRNLVLTLSPLQRETSDRETLTTRILASARGNSGNIAARFFSGFLEADRPEELPWACRKGRDLAYEALKEPRQGTILSLFDALSEGLDRFPPGEDGAWASRLEEALEAALLATRNRLPELEAAGVVDAGALGMFLFLRTCFRVVTGGTGDPERLPPALKPFLAPSEGWRADPVRGYCLDALVRPDRGGRSADTGELLGRDAIATSRGELLKVHLHTDDRQRAREELEGIGEIVAWASDDLAHQTRVFNRPAFRQALHVVTDAAGSIRRHQAERLGITLLDSYIQIDEESLPETCVDPERLLRAMAAGSRVSTAQASDWERARAYGKILDLHPRALYMTVGSFYTGNHAAAAAWKAAHDPDDRLLLMDTGVASGHLGLAALAAARYSMIAKDADEVAGFARRAVEACREVLFLDRLRFVAAGGRMSKTGAFFGDMLRLKPAFRPTPDGAGKVGVFRDRKDQVAFAFRRMGGEIDPARPCVIMLQHTDNRDWVESELAARTRERFPRAHVFVQQVSLTSAAHMGPGSWGYAFLQVEELDRMEPFLP
jgi:hypothetical protein